MRINERLARLEDVASSGDNRSTAADAASVTSMVARVASRFPASAAAIPLEERIAKMSPAEHCAWEMRFARDQTPIASIMAMHGRPFFSSCDEDRHAHN